jgi:hypothetical protein
VDVFSTGIRYSYAYQLCCPSRRFVHLFLVRSFNFTIHFENFTVVIITLLTVTEYLCHKWSRICSVCRNHKHVLYTFKTYHRICDKSSTTTCATSGAGIAYPYGTPAFTPGFTLVGYVLSIFVKLHVFSFSVPCCDVRYNCPFNPMFGSFVVSGVDDSYTHVYYLYLFTYRLTVNTEIR